MTLWSTPPPPYVIFGDTPPSSVTYFLNGPLLRKILFFIVIIWLGLSVALSLSQSDHFGCILFMDKQRSIEKPSDFQLLVNFQRNQNEENNQKKISFPHRQSYFSATQLNFVDATPKAGTETLAQNFFWKKKT